MIYCVVNKNNCTIKFRLSEYNKITCIKVKHKCLVTFFKSLSYQLCNNFNFRYYFRQLHFHIFSMFIHLCAMLVTLVCASGFITITNYVKLHEKIEVHLRSKSIAPLRKILLWRMMNQKRGYANQMQINITNANNRISNCSQWENNNLKIRKI